MTVEKPSFLLTKTAVAGIKKIPKTKKHLA
jgi:hypothetical protein